MVDEPEYREEPREEPLDFSRPHNLHKCPYCGETISAEELQDFLAPESNTFVCPNCRKKLNIHELGSSI